MDHYHFKFAHPGQQTQPSAKSVAVRIMALQDIKSSQVMSKDALDAFNNGLLDLMSIAEVQKLFMSWDGSVSAPSPARFAHERY